MLTYVLWTISNIQGPGGAETLRFSNLPYTIDSGPDAGESFQDSWTTSSYEAFSITRTGNSITQEGLLSVGGTVTPQVGEVEVANNYPSAQATVRQLDYLFSSAYDLSEATVLGELKSTSSSTPPTYSSFITFLSGRLARRPTKTNDTVKFYIAPRMSDLTGPLLKRRFSGMGSYYLLSASPAGESNPPVIPATGFSLQVYGSFFLGGTATGNQTLYKIQDSGLVALIDIYVDTAENLKLGIKYATGTDVYTLWTRPVGERGLGNPFFASVSWDDTGGTMSAWVNGTKVVDATPILHARTGTFNLNVFGAVNGGSAAMLSAVRVYNTAHSEVEILRREGPINYQEDTSILNAWEFDDGVGTICTDYGPNSRHVSLPAGTWVFRQLDGDRGQDDKIIPLVLGSSFCVPVVVANPKEPSGIATVTGSRITRAYSKGIPISTTGVVAATFSFNHIAGTIDITSGAFGRSLVPGESIEVVSAFDSQYNGVYVVKAITPQVSGTVYPSGTKDPFSVAVESHPWTSSGTGTATVQTASTVNYNWVQIDGAGLEPSPYTSAENIIGALYSWTLPQPLTADVVGDPTVYVSSPPSGYVNPDDFGNVIAQAVKTYGPAWDNTIFPVSPYVFGQFGYRVGYYVNDSKKAEEVIDDITRGCLIWMVESNNGEVSLAPFYFPEGIGFSEEISADEVDPSSVVTDRFSASARRDISSPFVTSVITSYARNWTPLQESDIPQIVDPEVRSFVSKEWREVISGDTGKITTDTPRFFTYENRKAEAQVLGDAVLRLSQGEVAELAIRMDPEEQLTALQIGAKVTGDLTSIGLGNGERIVIGRDAQIGTGMLQLSLWFEP